MKGGNLRNYLEENSLITVKECKFIVACIIQGLEFLHSQNIIHHDIKPENLLFDDKGYLRITDFGISQKFSRNMKLYRSGTLHYIAPEVIFGLFYDFKADYFSLGVIIYEIIEGTKPFIGTNIEDLMNSYVRQKLKFYKKDKWTCEAKNFVKKLLIKDSNKRLGTNGTNELKTHDWFLDINWDKLKEKKIKSPCMKNIRLKYEFSENTNLITKIHDETEEKKRIIQGFYFNRFNN